MSTNTVEAYDQRSFHIFRNLFDGEGKFQSTLYTSVKLDIDVNKNFITAPTQAVVYERFFDSVKKCSQFRFRPRSLQDRQEINSLQSRYMKLKNLVTSNSILRQHFGIPIQFANAELCSFGRLDETAKFCIVHENTLRIDPVGLERPASPPSYASLKRNIESESLPVKKVKSDEDSLEIIVNDIVNDIASSETESFLDRITLGLKFWNRY